jgi:cytochrome d ubiquinol oxidase subunit II
MALSTLWFVLVAALWTGYFVLEGFDFGVGALLAVVGRGDAGRAAVLRTIGPVWDGNEVWGVTAIAATFAAFPSWYASLLSTYYLPMLAILVALVVRAVGIEWRGKERALVARRGWDACIVACSLALPALWGGVFGALAGGPALLGAATGLVLALLHGARFLALRMSGEPRERALVVARRLMIPAGVTITAALLWPGGWPALLLLPVLLLVARRGGLSARGDGVVPRGGLLRGDGWAFAASTAAVAAVVAVVFSRLDLPASAGAYSLRVLTVAAVVLAPFVLAYQGWTYWVFRQRVS